MLDCLLQVCCKDLWYLEVDRPAAPGRVTLFKALVDRLEVNWQPPPQTNTFILQVRIDNIPINFYSQA